MARLMVKHRQAAQLEAHAKQTAKARAAARQRSVQRGGLVPPPEASLLGAWQIIQEEYIAQGIYQIEASLGNKVMRFDQLSPNGDVSGIAFYKDFSIVGAPVPLGTYPYTVQYKLAGKLLRNDICEFAQIPFAGDLAVVRGSTLFYYPLSVRVTWEDHLMFGEIKNESVGLVIRIRAVRQDEFKLDGADVSSELDWNHARGQSENAYATCDVAGNVSEATSR